MRPSLNPAHLLGLIWNSPIFGDAFPPEVSRRQLIVLSEIEVMYPSFVSGLGRALAQGMPLLPPETIEKLVQEIASTVLVLCSAAAAGEIAEVERLRAAALIISLVSWADQSMDGGDEMMLAAVSLSKDRCKTRRSTTPEVLPPTVQARLKILLRIEQEVKNLSRPEDAPTLLKCGLRETLQHDYQKRALSRVYGLQTAKDFWAAHTDQLVESLLITAATIHATAALYAAYRWLQPTLPSLPQIFQDQTVMDLLHGPYNAAIRIFDDLSDRLQDSRHEPGWREFNLNIFNQPEPGFIRTFLDRAGLRDKGLAASVLEAFQADTDEARAYILHVFREFVREQFAALPASTWNRYEVFLTLAKRIMEGGYVYFMQSLEAPVASH